MTAEQIDLDDFMRRLEHRRQEIERDRKLQDDNMLLVISLETAVPLWIFEHHSTDPDARIERAKELAQIVASEGDNILFRSKTRGKTACAFNALAEGLALMSYMPGGVKFAGLHWETT